MLNNLVFGLTMTLGWTVEHVLGEENTAITIVSLSRVKAGDAGRQY